MNKTLSLMIAMGSLLCSGCSFSQEDQAIKIETIPKSQPLQANIDTVTVDFIDMPEDILVFYAPKQDIFYLNNTVTEDVNTFEICRNLIDNVVRPGPKKYELENNVLRNHTMVVRQNFDNDFNLTPAILTYEPYPQLVFDIGEYQALKDQNKEIEVRINKDGIKETIIPRHMLRRARTTTIYSY